MRNEKGNIHFKAKLLSREEVVPDTFRLEFHVEDGSFSYFPGQYVWIRLDDLLYHSQKTNSEIIVHNLMYPDTHGEQRAFSISSPPNGEHTFSIIFRRSRSGYKNTMIEMPTGSTVAIIGPFGSAFSCAADKGDNIVFAAGGLGVTPFLSILSACLERGDGPPIHLIYSESSEERILPQVRELQERAEGSTFLKVTIHVGNVDADFVKRYNMFGRDAVWHISGPSEYVSILTAQLLSIGIVKTRMRFEENYPYFPYERRLVLPEASKLDEKNIYKLALDDALTHTIITDINGKILYANNAASEISGYSNSEIIGNTARLWGGMMDRTFYEEMWRMIKDDRLPFVGKVRNRKKSGEIYIAELSIAPIIESNGDLVGFYASEKNITELERIDRAKTEFVSLVSHQLRTPLSSVNWFSEMLLSGDAGELNSEQKKYLDEIYSGNQRMVDLVNDLLDVSRLDLGTFIIELVPTDIIQLAESVISEQMAQIEVKHLEFLRNFAPQIPLIPLDEKLIRMVLQNLLSNAIKYTQDNGKVEFSILLDADEIMFRLIDNGCGIPKQQQGEIFKKLFRADNVKMMDVEGTGLGLYIVKSIVESSNGKIWFESEENQGTSFYVTFPLEGMKKMRTIQSPF